MALSRAMLSKSVVDGMFGGVWLKLWSVVYVMVLSISLQSSLYTSQRGSTANGWSCDQKSERGWPMVSFLGNADGRRDGEEDSWPG